MRGAYTVFTKNRERLIEHDAVIELFNQVLEMAREKHILSGEQFSVDSTLIQAWAGHKSFVRKGGSEGGNCGSGGNFKAQTRSNDTHTSGTDADAGLYRKGGAASELRYMGHKPNNNSTAKSGNIRMQKENQKIKFPKHGLALAQGVFHQPAREIFK